MAQAANNAMVDPNKAALQQQYVANILGRSFNGVFMGSHRNDATHTLRPVVEVQDNGMMEGFIDNILHFITGMEARDILIWRGFTTSAQQRCGNDWKPWIFASNISNTVQPVPPSLPPQGVPLMYTVRRVEVFSMQQPYHYGANIYLSSTW